MLTLICDDAKDWAGFGAARTRALELAALERCDYALMLDADDTLRIADGFAKAALEHDVYNIHVEDGRLLHIRPHLIRFGRGYRYVRRIHEST